MLILKLKLDKYGLSSSKEDAKIVKKKKKKDFTVKWERK